MELVVVSASFGACNNPPKTVSINPKFVSNIVYNTESDGYSNPHAILWFSGNNVPFYISIDDAHMVEEACKIPETVRLVEVIVTPSSQH